MKSHQKKGYIIVMTMLFIALSVAIVTYIYKRGTIYTPLAQLAAHKEKARMIAHSGLSIACSYLGEPPQNNAQKKEPQEPSQNKNAAKKSETDMSLLYQSLLPSLQRWQTFVLKEEIDGVDATIRIAIGCEEGKINLNQLYDFEKKQFRKSADGKNDWAVLLKELFGIIEKQTGMKDLFESLKKFLNSKTEPLNDITELLAIKEFAGFKDALFYQPPKANANQTTQLYLSEI